MNTEQPNLTAPQAEPPLNLRYPPRFNDTYVLACEAAASIPSLGLPAPLMVAVKPPITDDDTTSVTVQYQPIPDGSDMDAWAKAFELAPGREHHCFTPDGDGQRYVAFTGAFDNGIPFEVVFVLNMTAAEVVLALVADHGPSEMWTWDIIRRRDVALLAAIAYDPYR